MLLAKLGLKNFLCPSRVPQIYFEACLVSSEPARPTPLTGSSHSLPQPSGDEHYAAILPSTDRFGVFPEQETVEVYKM